MAHLHCQRETRVLTQIQIPNLMATFNYAVRVHIPDSDLDSYSPFLYRIGI